MPAGPERFAEASDVSGLVGGIGQEVKCRPIVPHVIPLERSPSDHVGDDPCDAGGRWSQTRLRGGEGRFRQIENRHRLMTLVNQGIDELRRAPANIDDG